MATKQQHRFVKPAGTGDVPFCGFEVFGNALSVKQSEALTCALQQQVELYKREISKISSTPPSSDGQRLHHLNSAVNGLTFVIKQGYLSSFRPSTAPNGSMCVPLEDVFAAAKAEVDVSFMVKVVAESALEWAKSKRISEARPVYAAVKKLFSCTEMHNGVPDSRLESTVKNHGQFYEV